MHQDSEPLDHLAADGPARGFAGLQAPCEVAGYDARTIGYEAADPTLQTPRWHETMSASTHLRDGR